MKKILMICLTLIIGGLLLHIALASVDKPLQIPKLEPRTQYMERKAVIQEAEWQKPDENATPEPRQKLSSPKGRLSSTWDKKNP